MILTVIIGSTGSGKTHLAKQLIQKYPQICIYDVQNEYGLKPFDAKNNNKRFQLPNNIYTFKDFCIFTQRLKGYCFVIEEATGLFSGRIGETFKQSILSKRHTQNRYILIFHALHRVPTQIYEFADYVYLLKTNDLEKNVKSKYPHIYEDFKKLNKKETPKYSKILYKNTDLAKENKQ
jgi:hypothetical protein